MSSPLVSVVTATYNMGNYIEEAVVSVLNQTYDNFQYIIIDDGSTDNTREVLDSYLKDPRVEYYYQENMGQTVAKNNGIRKSKGDYICFLDSDNIWDLNKLKIQTDTFKTINPEYKIIYTHQHFIDEKGDYIGSPDIKRYSGNITEQLLFDNFVTFNTVMVKRECFEESGLMDEDLKRSIDYELWLRFSLKYDFYYLSEMTTYYRHWEGQMSQDLEKRFKVSFDIVNNFIQDNIEILDGKSVSKAYGHIYTSIGRYKFSKNEYAEAINNFKYALKYDFFSIYLWKSIAKMIVCRVKNI